MAVANDHLYEGQIISKVTDAGHDFGSLRDNFFNEFITGLDLAGAPPDNFSKKNIPLSHENNLLKRLMPSFVDMNALVDILKGRDNCTAVFDLPYSMNPALKTCTVKLLHKGASANVQTIATTLTTADWVTFFGTGDLYVIIDAFNYNLLKALDDRDGIGGINTYILLPRELVNDPAGKTYDLKKLKLKKIEPKFLLDQTPGNIVYTRNTHNLKEDSKQTFFSKFNVTLGPFSQDTTLPLKNLPHIRVEITDTNGRVVDSTDDPHNDNQITACSNTVYQYESKFTGNERANAIAATFQRKNSGDTLQGSVIDATDRIYYDQAYFDAIRKGIAPPPPHKLENKPFVLTHDRVLLYDLLVNNRNALFSCMGPGNEEHSQKYFLYFSFTGVEDPDAKRKRYVDQAFALITDNIDAKILMLNKNIDEFNNGVDKYEVDEKKKRDDINTYISNKSITNKTLNYIIQLFWRTTFAKVTKFTDKINRDFSDKIHIFKSDKQHQTIDNAEIIIKIYSNIENLIKQYPNADAVVNKYKSYETSLYKNIPFMLREYGDRVSKQSQARNEAETKVLLAVQSHLKAGLTALDYQKLYISLKDIRGGVPIENKIVLDTFLTLLAADLPADDEQSALELINLLPPEDVSLHSIAVTDRVISPEETVIGIFADAATALTEAKLPGATIDNTNEASSALEAAKAAFVEADIDQAFIEQFNRLSIAPDATPDTLLTAATAISEAIISKPGIDLDKVCKAAAISRPAGLIESGRNFASIVFGSIKSAISNIANKIYSYRAWLSGQAGGGVQRGGGKLPLHVNEYCANFIIGNYLSTLSNFISADSDPGFNSATILTILNTVKLLQNNNINDSQLEYIIFNILPNFDSINEQFNEFAYFSKQLALQSLGLASGDIPVMNYSRTPSKIIVLLQTQLIASMQFNNTNINIGTYSHFRDKHIDELDQLKRAIFNKGAIAYQKASSVNTRKQEFAEKRRKIYLAQLYNGYKSSFNAMANRIRKSRRAGNAPKHLGPKYTSKRAIGGRRTRRLRQRHHTHKKRRPINR